MVPGSEVSILADAPAGAAAIVPPGRCVDRFSDTAVSERPNIDVSGIALLESASTWTGADVGFIPLFILR